MCGLFAVIGNLNPKKAQELSYKMTHRGPDEREIYINESGYILCHERLSIVDLKTGKQPIQGTNKAYVVHNGEIYNHEYLRDNQLKHHTFRTTSDSEVIVHLYEEYGYDFLNMLDGVFAFVVVDGEKFIAGRDPVGVKPMYYGKDSQGNLYFSSEMKALAEQCTELDNFPPGHYFTPETGWVKYYDLKKFSHENIEEKQPELSTIRHSLTHAVRKRLMADVPISVLLSGGLDSSLIASITKRLVEPDQELHSFTIGAKGSRDLTMAKEVADFLGTIHHEVPFKVEEGIAAIEQIIWATESYDVGNVRPMIPLYFLSKYIQDMGIKVVLSGEGADEIFGGYLYFHNSPSNEEYQQEVVAGMQGIYKSDCLKIDRSMMAHGIEARVPFLDKDFLQLALSIHPKYKRHQNNEKNQEKYILRKAFDDREHPFLPEKILWRQKDQLSDGVGKIWITELKQYCENKVSDREFNQAQELYPYQTPVNKEQFLYRKIFQKYFPQNHAAKTVSNWIPKWTKSVDPSGRVSQKYMALDI